MNRYILICTAFIFFVLTVNLFASPYNGGSGTEADPYQITTKFDLLALADTTNDYDKCFVMTADIDLSGTNFTKAVIAPDTDKSVGGFQGTQFSGTFDGGGHVITNMYINAGGSEQVGLFGRISGVITNLGVVSCIVTNGKYYVGGICGYNNYGTISDCYESGLVNGHSSVGSLCGYNYYGTIKGCYALGSVTGDNGGNTIGGFCGMNDSGTIISCYATGSASGNTAVGGLCGYNYYGTIIGCYATGSVIGQFYLPSIGIRGSRSLGGLCGANYGAAAIVTECYAMGSVSGDDGVGGLCGENDRGTVTECYATGSVTGDNLVGGLCGVNGSTISSCYAIGSVRGDDDVGGFCGYNSGTVNSCFWDMETSGLTISSGGTGTDTVAMQSQFTFADAGWNFEYTWRQAGYPVLRWQGAVSLNLCKVIEGSGSGVYQSGEVVTLIYDNPFNFFRWSVTPEIYQTCLINPTNCVATFIMPETNVVICAISSRPVYSGGSGTDADPYQIANKADLLTLADTMLDYDKCFVLTADIDLSATNFTKAIIAPDTDNAESGFQGTEFSGTFDGGGHVISNMFIDASGGVAYHGLFGRSSGLISNLGVACCIVTNGCACVGGLCGENCGGTIRGCYVTGSFCGDKIRIVDYMVCWSFDIGGLCGLNSGTISECHSAGYIRGAMYVGGLCGENKGTVSKCYSTGSVSGSGSLWGGDDWIGGLCGLNSGTIGECYATGSVSGDTIGGLCGYNSGTVNSCFWDMDTSGLTTSEGGTGTNTAAMQIQSTFIDAGWDFVGETANGTDDIWIMDSYPALSWQDVDSDFDGLNDVWEYRYYSNLVQIATSDTDGDGQSALAEYIAGTNPTNALSRFAVNCPGDAGDGFVVSWDAVEGRCYNILWSPDLITPFTPLESDIDYPQGSYTDSLHNLDPKGFYKVEVYLK